MSLLRRSVDWNSDLPQTVLDELCRSFAGAWIEIGLHRRTCCRWAVAPSQERGLKYNQTSAPPDLRCRSFAGAWIEITSAVNTSRLLWSLLRRSVDWNKRAYIYLFGYESRSFAGAWIEIDQLRSGKQQFRCRSFAGAWIEIGCYAQRSAAVNVAPSQERGLKYSNFRSFPNCNCRSFAGTWIEIFLQLLRYSFPWVAPSQERGLKYQAVKTGTVDLLSFLRGSVHWNVIAAIRLKARYRPLFLKKSHQNCHESIKRCLSRC